LGDARPDHIQLEFLKRVREERRFETPEALRAQILKDVAQANRYFERTARLASRLHQPIG
jgi:riboflavin kinase/FMN adenylyltransferase